MKSSCVVVILCLLAVSQARFMYVGSWTGIFIYNKGDDGRLTQVGKANVGSSGFVAISPDGKNLYATGQGDTYVSYGIQDDGNLIKYNDLPGCASGQECWTTHVSVAPKKNYIFGANYKDGSFVAYSLWSNGALNQRTDSVTPGTGDNGDPYQNRQAGPHAHMITTAPGGKFVVGIDLGSDRIWVWKFDFDSGKFVPNSPDSQSVPFGSGSRHIAFHPSGKFAYVVNEIKSTVSVFSFNPDSGVFGDLQVISSLPPSMRGNRDISAGEIRVHPTGRFLYVTNRNAGSDNVGVFSIASNGTLSQVAFSESGGGSPRGMNLCPKGRFLYVANEKPVNGNSLRAFKIDQGNGKLSFLEDYWTGEGTTDVELIQV